MQAAPRPPTLPPNAWRWIYTALGAVAVLFVLIHVSRLGLNDDSEQEYGYIVVPVTDYRGGHRFGTHKADSAINALSDKAQACWVKFLSFPVAQVSVDGEDTAEAPAPTWHRVMPGQHVFKFWSSSPGESVEWRDTLKEGVRYLVKADLGQQTYSVSEVADP